MSTKKFMFYEKGIIQYHMKIIDFIYLMNFFISICNFSINNLLGLRILFLNNIMNLIRCYSFIQRILCKTQ